MIVLAHSRLHRAALTIVGLTLWISPAEALEWREAPELKAAFDVGGVDGTFVLYDLEAGALVGFDEERARTRFIPASTFKIPNSLIGLTVGAVESVDEVLPYGGGPQRLEIWEQDMALRDAIRVSNVPVYQGMARRIGLERMAEQVRRLDYGNAEIGEVVDLFWLVGPLEISPVEQVVFLADLARGELPMPKEAQAAVREILEIDSGTNAAGETWTLFAKTGWTNAPDPDIGWWVGWVKIDRVDDDRADDVPRIVAFAVNIDIQTDDDAPKRMGIGKACLRALGVL